MLPPVEPLVVVEQSAMDEPIFMLESITPQDMHCVILPSEGQTSAKNNAIQYYPMRLSTQTLGTFPFTFQVTRNYYSGRPQMEIETSYNFRLYMSNLDQLLADRLKHAFPNLTYRPIIKDNSSFVTFSLPSFRSSRECFLDVEVLGGSTKKDRLFGFNMLREKWHDFYCDASLLFDFSCVFVRDGIVGCNPRLLKIVYHSTAEEADQLKPM